MTCNSDLESIDDKIVNVVSYNNETHKVDIFGESRISAFARPTSDSDFNKIFYLDFVRWYLKSCDSHGIKIAETPEFDIYMRREDEYKWNIYICSNNVDLKNMSGDIYALREKRFDNYLYQRCVCLQNRYFSCFIYYVFNLLRFILNHV